MEVGARGRSESPGGFQVRSPVNSRVLSYFDGQNCLKMVFSFFFFLIFAPLLSANLLIMHIFNAWWDNFRNDFCAKRRNLCCATFPRHRKHDRANCATFTRHRKHDRGSCTTLRRHGKHDRWSSTTMELGVALKWIFRQWKCMA